MVNSGEEGRPYGMPQTGGYPGGVGRLDPELVRLAVQGPRSEFLELLFGFFGIVPTREWP